MTNGEVQIRREIKERGGDEDDVQRALMSDEANDTMLHDERWFREYDPHDPKNWEEDENGEVWY